MRLTPELVDRVARVDVSPPLPFTTPSDADYEEAIGFPAPGINPSGGIRARF